MVQHNFPLEEFMDHSAGPAAQGYWTATIAALNSCPYYELLGIRVVSMGQGRARLTMTVDEKLLQIYGVGHGGAVASLADSAMGVALISASREDEAAITIELKVNFVAPARKGLLTAEAVLFQHGRTIAGGDVEVRDVEGRLIAKAMGTYLPTRRK